MFRVDANDPHHALAVDHLALVTNLFYRCPYFHFRSSLQSFPAYDRWVRYPLPPDRPATAGQNSVSPFRRRGPAPVAGLLPTPRATPGWAVPPTPWRSPLPLVAAQQAPASRPGQNPRTVRRHSHAMLEVRRIRAVFRDRRPLVPEHLYFRFAGIHHRLDGEHHAFLQPRILVLPIHVIGHLRLLVQLCADPVPHVLPHDAESVRSHVLLHGAANIEKPVPCPHLLDRQLERVLGNLHQLLRFLRDL